MNDPQSYSVRPSRSRESDRRLASAGRRAFTLIEVLVVMGVIIILVALALPAFSYITGSRSGEAAGNQIAAALSVARSKAIGLQKYCGVMFFMDPTSDRVQLALVQQTDRPPGKTSSGTAGGATVGDADDSNVDVYLDLVPDSEFVKLPVAVGVQTVTNGLTVASTGEKPTDADRYIGFNTTGITSEQKSQTVLTKVGGVILFDGDGLLASKRYALRTRIDGNTPTRMGALLFYNANPDTADTNSKNQADADYIAVNTTLYKNGINIPRSQLGLVVYDATIFAGKNFNLADQRTGGATATDEDAEEKWLDENGSPSMVNRYNGTLVRGD